MASPREDLTHGPIIKKLVLFALPLLAGSLVQQLYNTVDLIFVGNYTGSSASAAIGASSLLINCLINFFGGMGVGSGVVISQIYGSKDYKRLSKAIHNTVALCLAGGLTLMVLGYILAPTYLRLIRTPVTIEEDAIRYLRIYFLSFLSVVTYNFGSGALRAIGDSKTPLYSQIFGGIFNIGADYIFVKTLQLGVRGAAWATLISQTAAALAVVYKLIRLDPAYSLKAKKIAFNKEILLNVLSVGLPAGIQAFVITLSNVMVQYHINSFGADTIAAFTAYFKVELIVYLPIMALGQAVMTFVGQNMGAGEWDRVRKGTICGVLISMALAAVTSFACLPVGAHLFRLFNKETAVIALGTQILKVTFPFYFVYPVLQIFGDSMRGVGRAQVPMALTLINLCLVRTALLFIIVPRIGTIQSVAAVYPITWALTGISMFVYYLYFHKTRKA